jgi:hypothetical protein
MSDRDINTEVEISVPDLNADPTQNRVTFSIKTAAGYKEIRHMPTAAFATWIKSLAGISTTLRTPIADAAYTILPADRYVALTAITIARTWTLPSAAAFPVGTPLIIGDESGQLVPGGTSTAQLTIAAAGSDTIDGVANLLLGNPYGALALYSNGGTKWSVNPQVQRGSVLPASPFYTLKLTDRALQVGAAGTGYNMTLPLAAGFPAGVPIFVYDAGSLGPQAKIGFTPTSPDTLNGQTTLQYGFVNRPNGFCFLVSDGISKWSVLTSANQIASYGNGDVTVPIPYTTFYLNTAFTAPRVFTLPNPNVYQVGTILRFVDPNGYTSPLNTLSVLPPGATTIDGVNAAKVVLSGAGSSELVVTGTSTLRSLSSTGGGGTAGAVTKNIGQATHGFTVGQVLRHSGGIYWTAQANSAFKAEVIGIVSAVIDANNFTLLTLGYVTGLSGLTPEVTYYLDDAVPGGMTTVEPTTTGSVSKPCFFADTATSGYFFNWRGMVVGSPVGVPFLTKVANVDLTVLGSTDVLTVPAGKNFVATDWWIKGVNVSGATGQAALNIIESGASTIMAGSCNSGTTLTATQYIKASQVVLNRNLCAGGNKVQVAVQTAATATAFLVDVYVMGYYLF